MAWGEHWTSLSEKTQTGRQMTSFFHSHRNVFVKLFDKLQIFGHLDRELPHRHQQPLHLNGPNRSIQQPGGGFYSARIPAACRQHGVGKNYGC